MLELLKTTKKVVGIKQCLKALENDSVSHIFIADDADERMLRNIKETCKLKSIEPVRVESMKALGKACGIEVGSAVACVLK
jgi:Ribosomal protein HS6-type (S12/L30/L7a)